MELLIWLWAYDRDFLFRLRYSDVTFVYIWLVPVSIAGLALILAYISQFMDIRELRTCFSDDSVVEKGQKLQKLVLMQEGIMVLIIFAGLSTMYQAD